MITRGKAFAVATLVALVLAACGGGGSASDGSEEDVAASDGVEDVKVGALFDLSGPTSDVGVPYADGVRDYVEFHNQEGDGPRIDLVSQDFSYDVAVAERVYTRFEGGEDVVAIQGWGTADTEALRGRISADGVPFMSASYADTLVDPGETPFNFVVATTYNDQMRIALDWIAEDGGEGAEVAVFHHDSPFGESPLEAGEERAQELGLGFESYAMPAEATDYVPQLGRAEQQGAEYVVVQNTSTPGAQLAKDIAQQGLDMQLVTLNWSSDELFTDLAGEAGEGAVGVLPFAPATASAPGLEQPASFLGGAEALEQKGLHYAQGWYTMAVMAEAIKHAAQDGDVTRESVKAALEEMEPVDTGEVTAPVDFTAESHAGMEGSRLFTVEDGQWTELTDLRTP